MLDIGSSSLLLTIERRYHICCRAAPPAAPAVTQLTSLLEQLDSDLSIFIRLRDASGIQETCRLIWGASLPLMQPGLRGRIKRPCASAAQALELIESQLHLLRQGGRRVQGNFATSNAAASAQASTQG